jgi:sterol desaturase/sphingolipid hydroxylase (fatty acid hydroxylase superfamily)
MDEATFQLIKSSGFALSFGVVFALQTLAPYRRAGRLLPGNWRQNVPLAVLNTAITSLACGACLCTAARYAEARGLGLLRAAGAPPWAAAAGTVVVLDFVLWAWHLANHRLSGLWRFHRVHHSDVDFDLSTSLRFHAVELLLSLPLKLATIVALGAPLAGILLFEVLFGLFNMFVHGNIRMAAAWERRLSRLLILPAVHRLHHSINPDQHGRNFGTVLSVWDRWLGTWVPGDSAMAVTTGLPDLAGSGRLSLWRCLALPFVPGASAAERRHP